MRSSDNRRATVWACRFLALSFLFGLLGNAVHASAPILSTPRGLPFAISDFDGDSRVDLATVSVGQTHSTYTEYWIQFQLSAAGDQTIRLVAPVGGLHLTARDVNGDKALDLIVSTAWSDRPVAVYLNNGHGAFKDSEPAEFLGVVGETNSKWGAVSVQLTEAVLLPLQWRSGIRSGARWLSRQRSHDRAITVLDAQLFFDSILISLRGRAPPSSVSCL